MAITFNADEVFEMAIEIEHRAAAFYRKAAENARDAKAIETLLNLSEMEKGHEAIFTEMRRKLTESEREGNVFDPEGEAVYYLQALADSHGWEGKAGPDAEFTGYERLENVYRAAIEAEKQSINFYVGLKEIVSYQGGRDMVQNIIREEMAHVVSLQKALAAM